MGKDLNDDTGIDSDDMEIGQPDQGDIRCGQWWYTD